MSAEKTPSGNPDELEELASAIGGLLLNTLPEAFHIDQAEANAIVMDTFVLWLSEKKVGALPADWITVAACSDASALQRARNAERTAAPGGTHVFPADSPFAKAMNALSEPERRALHLILGERKTYWDIARDLNVTQIYARRIVRGAVDKLRRYAREADEARR